jgi:beta-glucosidase
LKKLQIAFASIFCLTSVYLTTTLARSNPSSGSQTIPAGAVSKQIVEVTPVPREMEWWMPAHNKNVQAVQQGGIDIAIFGDSITEYMNEQLMHRILSDRAKNLGIKGDSTEHLLWRLQNGELEFKKQPPKLAVVLIGTNNFSHSSDNDLFLGVKADVDEIRKRLPSTKILVVGMLPRGESPSYKLRARIIAINSMVAKLADNHTIWYADISKNMLEPDGTISRAVMDDYLHPTKEVGYTKMLEALKPDIDKIITSKH